VDAGASQARQATALLSEILERVRGSSRAVQSIADASDEQARGSASVTTAMLQVADNVRGIAVAASEQARGAGHIRELTESLREVVNQVGGASREQREGARLLAEVTSKVNDMVEALSRLQARQSQSGERIRVATATIRAVADEHRSTVAGVGQAAEELGKHAELLGAEIERFKIH
jgi:methyl-accepting chemotaxis protein